MRPERGFTLIEVAIGIVLVGIALLGLAQLFVFSVYNNGRAEQMAQSTFYAEQQVENLRSLTAEELTAMSGTLHDEFLDPKGAGNYDVRRLTRITPEDFDFHVRVWVFYGEKPDVPASVLIEDTDTYKPKASISSVISR